MRALSHLYPVPQLQLALIEPFNAPSRDHPATAKLYALAGSAAVLQTADHEDDAWDPSADEETGGFDIHLGVYASD